MLATIKINKAKTPRLPYLTTMKKLFGGKYNLDLIFATPSIMKKIYKKNTNVLSFDLSKNQGQIFLEPNLIKKEAGLYNRSFRQHVWALYIHGLLHLKGYGHGQRMEIMERKLCRGI
ncbi:rRNA maturation RNase YbeY [Candidatus Giovannonibacteria bacterium RIFCSPLOWO2_02_FULL_43_11b]|uniref:rRNA maturation RNase YbeY n=1 Tax=Candidatus Giovannonibacteria bacterium RIFCSPHIGHO2_12_FULL_43_15 TaxID=1798341 RepID=A0A1F5WQI9_9BACT|nr:MAG: rRNA maturation RNase YbeY [Candidatus Giovannonibacteria bacterium RIFCSPHIGHO2_02_FULL_43_32]OGF77943.1 MAG: rRNA maturation RNase YbeY [Candidatus Giovannonibacteria bacterium RIFCSPHIGHO2_12_FULL_43_15]OGF78289.1 MAG: rRNA maturation RNase YbeY [Candidatus Giovannonibacteria bacterium RIFCSPLOWO2_01_FULL_43_60]OGF90287.1 MAG: rRNA maturation RNase YbeY [Candidatus Giovannonibacteria bacterium RIFCSPLOWO2_02_FULL_43_11b]